MQQIARVAQQVVALRPAQPGCLGKRAAHTLLQDHSWATALCQIEHSAVTLQQHSDAVETRTLDCLLYAAHHLQHAPSIRQHVVGT